MNGQYDEDEAFREILNKQEQLTLFESVYVDFWGTGLNQVRTEHTGHKKWPGQNIQTYLSENSRRPPRRFESVQRNHSVIFWTFRVLFGNPIKKN